MKKATNQNDILCPLCLDILTAPRVLPCLHTYCQSCLGDYIRISIENDGVASSFECPACEKETLLSSSGESVDKWEEKFPYDWILLSMLPDGKNNVGQLCKQCMMGGKKEPADSFCTTCIEALCKTCVNIHINGKLNHSFVNISDPSCPPPVAIGISVGVKCSRHSHGDLEYLCGTHEEICCSECLIDDHGNCKEKHKLKKDCCMLLESKNAEHLARYTNKLTGYLDKRTEMNKDAVSKIDSETKSMVDEIDNLISLLNETKNRIIKEREELLKRETQNLDENNLHYHSLKVALINSLRSYEEVCKYGNNYECFVILHKIEDQIVRCEKILQNNYSQVIQVNSKLQLSTCLQELTTVEANQLARVSVTETTETSPLVPLIVRRSALKLDGAGRFRLDSMADQSPVENTRQLLVDDMSRGDASRESQAAFKGCFRALFEYDAGEDDELSFKEGDILQLIDDSNSYWWLARHTDRKYTNAPVKGYIPWNYVVECTLEDMEWFSATISGLEAEQLLEERGVDGSFLVRQYGVRDFIVYGRHKGKIRHFKIQHQENFYFLQGEPEFATVLELVCYYMYKQITLPTINGDGIRLKHPADSRETKKTWEIPRHSLKFVEKCYVGDFGDVWTGKLHNKKHVAIKTHKQGTISPETFLEQATVMMQLRHDKLLHLYGICSHETQIYIITELMSKGNLHSYLTEGEGRDIDLKVMVDMSAQIASGMSYLEEHKLIHRDLAARNILVGNENIVKVAGFRMTKVLHNEKYIGDHGEKIPVRWTSPDEAYSKVFTMKCDVWSFGILLMEIVTKGVTPYPGMTNIEVLEKVDCGYRMPKPSNCPDSVYKIMLKCWDRKAENRPTFDFLYSFFDDYFINTEDEYEEL